MVLLSITVLTVDAKDVPVLSSVRNGVIDLLAPVGRGIASATRPIRSWWGGATDYDQLEAENARLRRRVAELEGEAARNIGAAAELDRLRAQLGIPFVGDIPSVVAQVATGPFSDFDDNTLQLDRGSASGLAVDMPVVTAAGLVGRVSAVTAETATVQLITDPEFTVGVKLAGTGNIAIGHGVGPGNAFVVDEGVELAEPVEVDETVLTSGLGRASFPKDIPIGSVIDVAQSQSDQTQKLEVRLAADLERLDVVQVLRWEPPE